MSDDLPTFERPMNANSGRSEGGHSDNRTALLLKFAD
jgi:hypothetical protein